MHNRPVVILIVLAGLMVALLAGPAHGAPGLVDTKLPTPAGNPLSSPTTISPILNTGRAFVLEKGGAVRILEADGTLATADALILSVCTASEQGLLGAAVDATFATDGFVYLYYSRDAGGCASSTTRFNRVSRFKMIGNPLTSDTIDLNSELILLDNMNIPAGNHNAGDLHFGNDGDLYVSVGDGGTNPRNPASPSPSAAQDLSLLNGKILRITPTGGVPADNPLVGTANATSCATLGISAPTTAKCTEIYDYGLRNPFRFAMDPNTTATRFFINDVGEGTWEEVDNGGKGLNYGWDTREGFCAKTTTTNCDMVPGFTDPMTGFTDPLTAYNHSTGCLFITAAAFIPNGIWDPAYDGGYLFADGGCNKIFLMTAAGTVDYANPFDQTTGTITDMAFLTQGGQTALYYVTNGSSELHRITLPPAPPPGTPTVPTTPTTPTTPTMPTTTPTVPASTPTLPSAPVVETLATMPQPPAPPHCTIIAVRKLLAATARARIRASHCVAHQIVIALRDGRPVLTRHHTFVHARSIARPTRSAGHHRIWTLRVEKVLQRLGHTSAAGSRETIWVGWESTPRSIAKRSNAHFL